ncbi:putative HTH-type transcriptional regulator YtcD [compost metagenome]
MIKNIKKVVEVNNCMPDQGLALLDLVNIFSGKWKIIIIGMLLHEDRRFTDLKRVIPDITPRMLSKELKELELNGIVKREVFDSTPVLIKYGLTDSAKKLEDAFANLLQWASEHRSKTIKS